MHAGWMREGGQDGKCTASANVVLCVLSFFSPRNAQGEKEEESSQHEKAKIFLPQQEDDYPGTGIL